MHRRSDRSSGIIHLTITGAESLGQVQQLFPSQKEMSESKCCRSSRVTCLHVGSAGPSPPLLKDQGTGRRLVLHDLPKEGVVAKASGHWKPVFVLKPARVFHSLALQESNVAVQTSATAACRRSQRARCCVTQQGWGSQAIPGLIA